MTFSRIINIRKKLSEMFSFLPKLSKLIKDTKKSHIEDIMHSLKFIIYTKQKNKQLIIS